MSWFGVGSCGARWMAGGGDGLLEGSHLVVPVDPVLAVIVYLDLVEVGDDGVGP